MNEPQPEYLTVSQAAARLGISERQARRYAGRLAPDDRREAGHMTGALVRLAAMQNERKKAIGRAQTVVRPDAPKHEAGHDDRPTPDATPDMMTALLSEKDARINDLRAQVEAWRLQAEAANRTASETSAALREALKAMPKALPKSGSTPDVPPDNQSRENAPQSPQTEGRDQTGATVKPVAQRGGKAPKLTAWQRVAVRILGIRS